jgi:hypothetical protein
MAAQEASVAAVVAEVLGPMVGFDHPEMLIYCVYLFDFMGYLWDSYRILLDIYRILWDI